jgi:Tol biopolymer transport system component
VLITYNDSNCDPRPGVPPESLVITWSTLTPGNARINDKAYGTFADDSTDANGQARFTFPSLSGCGKVRLTLIVSGVEQGTMDVQLRTTDADIDLDRRVVNQSGYDYPACDLDWNGTADASPDRAIVDAHAEHWRRNALHGTPIALTSLCETDCGSPPMNKIGSSDVFWSPNGKWISFTIESPPDGECRTFIAAADPALKRVTQFTFGTIDDYNPAWSPLGDELVIGRDLHKIIRKGIPGLASDTSETVIAQAGSGVPGDYGDVTPAVRPDGQMVAFARRDTVDDAYDIWVVPISGGTPTKVTNNSGTPNDQYPQWSPDGEWIIYDHEDVYGTGHRIWKVKADGTQNQEVYSPGSGKNAATPAFAPDGLIVTAGIGTRSGSVKDTRTYTIDPGLSTKKPILNYPETIYSIAGVHPVLSPRLSPDGTRLVIRADQLHAVARNMNTPPRFTQIVSTNESTQSLHDTVAVMLFNQGSSEGEHTIVVTATDPELDSLSYAAYFIQTWMDWNPTTRTLTCDPTSSQNLKTYYVRFVVTARNGGTDSFIAKIRVTNIAPGPGKAKQAIDDSRTIPAIRWNNRETLLSAVLPPGASGALHVFDLTGRLVAVTTGGPGSVLIWNGQRRGGRPAPSGVYLYRVRAGEFSWEGKVALAR